ncbi:STAS domain-containing protein [Streptacidiphilus sp. PB12-B1b]|uniref:STAS domain-containing protein n=1 Tax=Streptacidiphilus sp. PB12-B1b TaxID=2705012 RepID=UPI0015F8DB44|nr:STAS domain-containing protein [Streptacidiphilus sp. PB12-B1b]QMU77223.1 STAS domain-containing protein [Streptacidiphilus sp. PB12-B1b]
MATDDGPRTSSYPVIAAQGDLDGDTLGPLTAELEAAAAQHPVVILDASAVTFSDSSFLRLVMLIHQRTDLRIAAPSPVVARLFQLISVDAILHLYPTLEDARSAAHRFGG